MSATDILLGGVRCISARAVFKWTGVWIVDLDIDPDGNVTAANVPTGAQTLTIGDNITMQGAVDPQAAGRWIAGVHVRLVGGGNGWDQNIAAQGFSSSSGVSSLYVENATAGLVGEVVNDPSPISLGLQWTRTAGPASRVFTTPDRSWYVDLNGITQVGTWPTVQPDPTVEILEWDPLQQRATLSADALVLPGTQLTDPAGRFDGTFTIRDVQQTWDKNGNRVTAWCSAFAISRLQQTFKGLVEELGNLSSLRTYFYRVSTQNGAMLTLQAVLNPDGTPSEAPDLTNVLVWPGMSGASAQYLQGSLCNVVFTGSSRYSNPVVVSFDQSLPNSATYDTTGDLKLGPSASSVILAGGGPALGRVGDTVLVYFPPTMLISGVVNETQPFTGTLTIPGPGVGSIQTGSNKANSG